jgi:hypothetical protein
VDKRHPSADVALSALSPPLNDAGSRGKTNYPDTFKLGLSILWIISRYWAALKLPEALAQIQREIRLDELPVMPRTKSSHRKDKRSYQEILSQQDREKIAELYREEIELFGF